MIAKPPYHIEDSAHVFALCFYYSKERYLRTIFRSINPILRVRPPPLRMEIQEAIKDLDQEISEMNPQEAIEALEELYRVLPNLIFLMKLIQLKK